MAEPTVEPGRNAVTAGTWNTEKQAADAFDAAIGDKLWRVYREVPARLLQPRPGQLAPKGDLYIDRVLVPQKRLVDAGWPYGAIGVELKRSGIKINDALAQAMDYSRCLFELPKTGRVKIALDWVFVWPVGPQSGTVASMCEQNHIGSAFPGNYSPGPALRMKSGEVSIVDVWADGTVDVKRDLSRGRRVGSR